MNSVPPSPLQYNKAATRKLAKKSIVPILSRSHQFVLVLSISIISKVMYRQNCPWSGLLTTDSKSVNQRGGVGMEGWVNPVKTFGHKTLGVFYVNSKDRFYRQGTHLITFVYDNGSSEVKL